MSQVFRDAVSIEALNALSRNTLIEHLGITFTAAGEDWISATMPASRVSPVMVQDAPIDWIAVARFEPSVATHSQRKARWAKGESVEGRGCARSIMPRAVANF